MSIKMKPITPSTVSFRVRGTSPLIQHAWSEKAKAMLRMTAAERKKQPKVKRDPDADAIAAMHTTPDGRPAIPMLAFKASLISAAHKDLGIEKTLVRKALFLPSSAYHSGLLAEMDASEPQIREDMVRVGANQTDIRYRPQFDEWSFRAVVEIDPELINEQDIVNLVNRAGFSVGIGEWRPEKGGEFGRFEFDPTEPMETINRDGSING